MARKKRDDDKKLGAEPTTLEPPVESAAEPPADVPPEAPQPPQEPEKEPARPMSPAEQAAALAGAQDRQAELERQRAAYNPGRDQPHLVGDGELKLSARQFVRVKKHQWRHAAGFLAAMKHKLGPMTRLTVKQWTVHWDAFWTQPVKGPR